MISVRIIYVMDLTVADAANLAGVTTHQVNTALRTGALHALRTVGSTVLMDDLAVQAWNRARGRGRRWSRASRDASLDLASTGVTEQLDGTELSRLKRVLRSITARQFAYLAGGLGGSWARYRALERLTEIDPIYPAEVSREFQVAASSRNRVVRTDNLDRFEERWLLQLDGDGDLGVVERSPDPRRARQLLDIYLLGSARESIAAAEELEAACHGL